jgi:hypothetical protein
MTSIRSIESSADFQGDESDCRHDAIPHAEFSPAMSELKITKRIVVGFL